MQYGQIVLILFIALLLYYAALVAMDVRKEMASRAAGHDGDSEEDIDISDEAKSFKPVKVGREEKAEGDTNNPATDSQADDDGQSDKDNSDESQRQKYGEALMTDGVPVERIIEEVNLLAERGEGTLGAIIFSCENAR